MFFIRKPLKSLICLGLLSSSASFVFAQESLNDQKNKNFATVNFGISKPEVFSNNSNIASVNLAEVYGFSVGRKVFDQVSLSLEYQNLPKITYKILDDRDNQYFNQTWSYKTSIFSVNAMVDLMKNTAITPFVKLGAGLAVNKASSYNHYQDGIEQKYNHSGRSINNFAWNLGFGLNFPFNEYFDTQVVYSYYSIGKAKTHGNTNFYDANSIRDSQPKSATNGINMISFVLKFKF